jgi:hypothetical protein
VLLLLLLLLLLLRAVSTVKLLHCGESPATSE